MRFGVCTLVVVTCAVVLGGSADSARTQGGADWNLKPITATQKWLRVDVQGDTLYGFRVRGTDFTLTGIKSVRASGGTAPECSVTDTPPTLTCNGKLPGGIAVFVQLLVSGAGGSYDFALLFRQNDQDLFWVPSSQTPAPDPLGGTFGKTSDTKARVTITNPSKTTTYQQLEIEPIGFRATGVATQDCAVTEGGGVGCQAPLGPGKTVAVTMTTEPIPTGASVVLLAHGTTSTGFILAPLGDPCADVRAQIAKLQAEAAALKGQIGAAEKELEAAKQALEKTRRWLRGTLLPGAGQKQAAQKVAETEKRVNGAQGSLEKLKDKLDTIQEEIHARQRLLRQCEGRGRRKAAAAAACDSEGLMLSRKTGKVRGLGEALPVERRLAAKARPAIVLMKQVGGRGGPGVRQAITHFTALSLLPGKTQKTLVVTAKAVARASTALEQCRLALQQD